MDLYRRATEILCEGTNDSYESVHAILEDNDSPITKKYIEDLYKKVIDKSHVDFGDIPKSKGAIIKYSGYATMRETLSVIQNLATKDSTYGIMANYATCVQKAIDNLTAFSVFYQAAFAKDVEVIKLEYNTFVFTCVEATTSILYLFTDFMQTPSSHKMETPLADNKHRANAFYIDQLAAFNNVCASGKYQKYLNSMIKSGTENFFGADDAMLVGSLAVISAVMLSILPITRALIYRFQDLRGRLSEALELQAYFLEMNKTVVEADKSRSKEKNKEILKKQDALRVKFLRMAEKLKVKSERADRLAEKTLDTENKSMSTTSMRDEVDNDDFSLL